MARLAVLLTLVFSLSACGIIHSPPQVALLAVGGAAASGHKTGLADGVYSDRLVMLAVEPDAQRIDLRITNHSGRDIHIPWKEFMFTDTHGRMNYPVKRNKQLVRAGETIKIEISPLVRFNPQRGGAEVLRYVSTADIGRQTTLSVPLYVGGSRTEYVLTFRVLPPLDSEAPARGAVVEARNVTQPAPAARVLKSKKRLPPAPRFLTEAGKVQSS